MNTFWIWLVVGLIPYDIVAFTENGRSMLQVHALFWSLDIVFPRDGQYRGVLHIPLIEWLGRNKSSQP